MNRCIVRKEGWRQRQISNLSFCAFKISEIVKNIMREKIQNKKRKKRTQCYCAYTNKNWRGKKTERLTIVTTYVISFIHPFIHTLQICSEAGIWIQILSSHHWSLPQNNCCGNFGMCMVFFPLIELHKVFSLFAGLPLCNGRLIHNKFI